MRRRQPEGVEVLVSIWLDQVGARSSRHRTGWSLKARDFVEISCAG
jgi:hypothetical protein